MGTAQAQQPGNIVEALLGPNGPVQGLLQSAEQGNLGPLVDGLASDTGLIQGDIAAPLNSTLTAALVDVDLTGAVNSGGATLFTSVEALNAGLVQGEGIAPLFGPGALVDLSYGSGDIIGLDIGTGLGLEGLPGGEGLSPLQLNQLNGLLGQ